MTRSAVLVTGGSSGIGEVMAGAAARLGRRVGVVSRRPAPTSAREVDWVRADLADAEDTASAVRGWVDAIAEPLDGVVLSAVSYGDGPRHPVAATPLAEWDEVIAVTLRSQYVVVSAVLPELLARPRAVIVSVSSIAAVEPAPGRAHYAAAKAGAYAFHRALAAELAGTGVAVVQVMPKNQVATPGLRPRRPAGYAFAGYDSPEVFSAFTERVLDDLGREFDGRTLIVDGDGNWEGLDA